jgi:DNA repair protein RadA/Sms
MSSEGLEAIRDASAYLLADRTGGLPGSVLAACVDGRRPYVCEIQALVMESNLSTPRRTAIGVDAARLPLLLAVLEKRAKVELHKHDVYVSAVGGIKAAEPACDLPVAMAIYSALREKPLPDDAVAFGEIGLSGQVRQVTAADRRLLEAEHVGCARAFVPYNFTGEAHGIDVQRVRHVLVALERIEDCW